MSPTAPAVPGLDDAGVFIVEGGHALVGRVRVPGDKSVSHRGLLLGALADGDSVLRGLSDGDDVARTASAVQGLGARLDTHATPGATVISGGADTLHEPVTPLDLGNSGTTMRLLAGVVAGLPFTTELTGDASLSSRPMDRVAVPLRQMGATVEGRSDRCLPPLTIGGGALAGIDYTHTHGQRSGEVVRAPGRAERQGRDRRARAGAHPAAYRGDAGALPAPKSPKSTATTEATWCGSVPAACRASSSTCPVTRPRPPSGSWPPAWCRGATITVERVYVGPGRRGYLDVLGPHGGEHRGGAGHGAR